MKADGYSLDDKRIETKENDMHGPAVLSLLVGKNIGTAPEAEVYYYSCAAWELDQTRHAECLYQIIEQNKTLPDDKKIRMVGFSDNIDDHEANVDAFTEAVHACEDAGVMVWFCADYAAATFIPLSDKNDPNNVVAEWWAESEPEDIFIPCAGRTTAATDGAKYIYWGESGLSWAMPYVLGLYAIAIEIDPTLTQDELYEMLIATATINAKGMQVVNPVGFVAAVLRRVGRDEEAQAMLDEVKARTRYLYAVMDTASMTNPGQSRVLQPQH